MANSTVWVFPKTIIPASTILRTRVAVRVERRSFQTIEPPVVIFPSMSMMSLTATGMPCNGPMMWPLALAMSEAEAALRESSS